MLRTLSLPGCWSVHPLIIDVNSEEIRYGPLQNQRRDVETQKRPLRASFSSHLHFRILCFYDFGEIEQERVMAMPNLKARRGNQKWHLKEEEREKSEKRGKKSMPIVESEKAS